MSTERPFIRPIVFAVGVEGGQRGKYVRNPDVPPDAPPATAVLDSNGQQGLGSVAVLGATVIGDGLFLSGMGTAWRIGAVGVRPLTAVKFMAHQLSRASSKVQRNIFAQVAVRGEAAAGMSHVAMAVDVGGLVVAGDLFGGLETMAQASPLGLDVSPWDLVPVVASGRALFTAVAACR